MTVDSDALKRPAVSVVMPCYNVESYLDEAMRSALGQTLKDIEIVCVNDGSKDSTLAMLQAYAEEDPRVVILDGPNGGYGCAMNKGMAAANGEYIAILEPDDYIELDMFEALYKAAKKSDADCVKSDYYRFWAEGENGVVSELEHISAHPEYYDEVVCPADNLDLFNMQMMNWTGIYRTDFLRNHDIKHHESPGASYQDNGFWFQVFCWARRMVVVPRAFYHYRQDNANSSINQNNKVFCMPDEYKWIRAFLSRNPDLEKHFLSIFHYKKMHNYDFAYSLLAEQFQMPFAKRYSEEYREANSKGEIDKSLYWPLEWNAAEALFAGPEAYIEMMKWRADFEKAKSGTRFDRVKFRFRYKGLSAVSDCLHRRPIEETVPRYA